MQQTQTHQQKQNLKKQGWNQQINQPQNTGTLKLQAATPNNSGRACNQNHTTTKAIQGKH